MCPSAHPESRAPLFPLMAIPASSSPGAMEPRTLSGVLRFGPDEALSVLGGQVYRVWNAGGRPRRFGGRHASGGIEKRRAFGGRASPKGTAGQTKMVCPALLTPDTEPLLMPSLNVSAGTRGSA